MQSWEKKQLNDKKEKKKEKKEEVLRPVIHSIFTTNYRGLVVIGSNLNLPLKLLFSPTNNNS